MLARSFGGRILFLHVLDLSSLYAYDSGGDVAAALSMLELTPEKLRERLGVLSFQPGIGESRLGEAHGRRSCR